jgi:hypothetical protein
MSNEDKTIIYLTDRSAAETDDTCGMKFYWNRVSCDGGIVPREDAEALRVGAAIHEDMELIAELEDISPANLQAIIDGHLANLTEDDKLDQKRMEILYRRLGWFAAWGLFKEPALREGWENVAVEPELVLDRTPLWVQVKPDRLLRSKADPSVIKYLEYKSALSASKKWLESWRYQIQIHTSLMAVEEETGLAPRFAQIVGLLKGGYSPADGRMSHPYVWGYYNSSSGEWTHDYNKARSGAWSPMPIWEFNGGVVDWVSRCGADTASNIFPSTAPIFLDERMLNDWIARRTAREQQIEIYKQGGDTSDELRNLTFPKINSKCRPAYGDPCPYVRLCWNADAGKDPLGKGDFIKRTPHHDLEAIGVI